DWASYELQPDEVAPGVLAVGARPAMVTPAGPSADPEGWCTLDYRTYKGWLASERENTKHPLDCMKTFQIPADMEEYGQMEDRDFDHLLKVYTGRVCGPYLARLTL